MNFGKSTRSMPLRQSGNAVIYILIALALLGALTVAITRGSDNASTDLSNEQAEFQATQILSYASAAQNVIDQMVTIGVDPGAIDFVLPTKAAFTTLPDDKKFFHPSGGGFNYAPATTPPFETLSEAGPAGWYVGRFNNVEWTPTTAQDIIIAARGIPQSVCKKINKKITGSDLITAFANTYTYLISPDQLGTAYTNSDFTKSVCAACEGKPAWCVGSNTTPVVYTYYSIILSR